MSKEALAGQWVSNKCHGRMSVTDVQLLVRFQHDTARVGQTECRPRSPVEMPQPTDEERAGVAAEGLGYRVGQTHPRPVKKKPIHLGTWHVRWRSTGLPGLPTTTRRAQA